MPRAGDAKSIYLVESALELPRFQCPPCPARNAKCPAIAPLKECLPGNPAEETYQDALVGRKLKGLLAAALVCPLSPEIFQDPVIAADGHSYERREIEAWFSRGKRTSPKTNEELPNAFLVPNRHLKAMCQQFLDEVREVEEAGG